jgi:Protein of unknown function (DUF3562)
LKTPTPVFCATKAGNIMAILNDTKSTSESDLEYLEMIKALAEEIDCPIEEVTNIFASTLNNLKSRARVQDYLIVLASKKVRDELRH